MDTISIWMASCMMMASHGRRDLYCLATGSRSTTRSDCPAFPTYASCHTFYAWGDTCYCFTYDRRCESNDGSQAFITGEAVDKAMLKIWGYTLPHTEYGRYDVDTCDHPSCCHDCYPCCLDICNELEDCIAVQTIDRPLLAGTRIGQCYFIRKCDRWVKWDHTPVTTYGTYFTDKCGIYSLGGLGEAEDYDGVYEGTSSIAAPSGGYCSLNDCNGIVYGGEWCNQGKDICLECGPEAQWCDGSSGAVMVSSPVNYAAEMEGGDAALSGFYLVIAGLVGVIVGILSMFNCYLCQKQRQAEIMRFKEEEHY